MNIPIENKMVLLIGPTTSGKTTLSYQLKKTSPVSTTIISQDEVVDSVINQEVCSMFFSTAVHKKYRSLMKDALKKKEGLIVLDMLDIGQFDVTRSIFRMQRSGYFGKITLLKLYPSFSLHSDFCGKRDVFHSPISTEQLFRNMVNQRKFYQSSSGSLHHQFPFTTEYVIEDPREVEFSYSLESPKEYKKQK